MLKTTIYTLWIASLAIIYPVFASAADSAEVLVRPQAGIGYINTSAKDESVSHVGTRILLSSSEIQKYGLEVSQFSTASGKTFNSVGIVLEQKLWGWFHMAIGTVGYFGYGTPSKNIAGLMTNLGWEPDSDSDYLPFVTYRSDFVFDDKTDMINSISVGVTLRF